MTKTALIVGVSIILAIPTHAQKKKNEPAADGDSSFSSESRLVVVDSVVTDKKGAYIDDLTRKDFKVRQDGKEQTITNFSYEADGTPDDQKRFLVLVFDEVSVPQIDQHLAREAATKFIGSAAGPNRLISVVEFDGTLRVSQNLTDDAVRLKVAVNGARPSVTLPSAPGAIVGPLNTAKPGPAALPAALRSLARGLARLPGRKTVILFSEGLSVSHDVMKDAIEECNRANAAIYPVDVAALGAKSPGGSVTGDASLGRSPALQSSVPGQAMAQGIARQAAAGELSAAPAASDALYDMAKGTGGFVVSSAARLATDLNRIGREVSQYYVLAYRPAKELQSGICHSLKVQTDRSGANVRSRNSYCDVAAPEVQDGTALQRTLEARLNANEAPTVHATMQTPFFYIAPNIARVDLALDIPGSGVKFIREKGKFSGTVNFIGIAYLPDGGVAARFNEVAKVVLDDQQQVEEFASRPYHFEKQFELASGTFDLKVAFSSGTAGFGALESRLTIDEWNPSKFLLSGLALIETTRAAVAPALGEVDLYGDQVPLNANGVQFIPAGTNRLQKSQKAFIYGEVYEPAVAAAGAGSDPGLALQLTVFDQSGAVKSVGRTGLHPDTVPGTSGVPFGLVLPSGELAAGSYVAEIIVLDSAGHRAIRRTEFELTP